MTKEIPEFILLQGGYWEKGKETGGWKKKRKKKWNKLVQLILVLVTTEFWIFDMQS